MSGGAKAGSPTAAKGKPAASKRKAATKTIQGVMVLLGNKPATGLYLVYAPLPPATAEAASASGLDKLIQEVTAVKRPKYTLGMVDAGGYVQDVKPEGNPWENLKANPHSDKLVAGVSYAACLVAHPDPAFGRAMERYLGTGKAPEGIAVPPPDKLKAVLQTLKVEAGTGKIKGPVINLPTESSAYWPTGSERYGKWNLYWEMPHARLDTVKKAMRELLQDLGALRFPVSLVQTRPYTPDEVSWPVLTAAIHAFQRETAQEMRAFKIAGKAVNPRDLAKKASSPGRTGAKASWAFLLGQPVKLVKAEPPKPEAAAAAKVEPPPAGTIALKSWLPLAEVSPGVVDRKTGDAIGDWLQHGLRKHGHILVEIWTNMENATVPGGEKACLLWAREELAIAIEAWRELTVGLGCLYGLSCHHTFRELTKPARKGSGAVETSRHKLGLSVDLSNWNYSSGKSNWPIRFEIEWHAPKDQAPALAAVQKKLKEAKAKTDAAIPKTTNPLEHAKLMAISKTIDADLARLQDKVKEHKAICKPWWRLYAHSILDCEQPSEALAAQVKARLGFVSKGTESAVEANHKQRLADCCGTSATSPEFLGFWQPDKAPKSPRDRIRAAVENLIAMSAPVKTGPSLLVSSMFRSAISPFVMQGFDVQGGYEEPPTKADADAPGVKVTAQCSDPCRPAKSTDKPKVKSWLNLSRLAYECGLVRVPGQTTGDSFRRPDADIAQKFQMGWDNLDLVSKHLGDSIIPDLRKLAATATRDSTMKERALFLVSKGGSSKEFRSLTIGDIDIDFLEQWQRQLPSIPLERNPPHPPVFRKGAVVSLVLARIAAPDAAVTKFLSTYSGKQFRVAASALLYPKLAAKDEVVTGKVLASRIDELAKASKDEKAALPSESRRTSDYCIGLVPVFELPAKTPTAAPAAAGKPATTDKPAAADKPADGNKSAAPAIFVELDTDKLLGIPTRGRPGKFEWWHFDHENHRGQSWLDLGDAIGYSVEVLKAAKGSNPPFWQGGLGYGAKTNKFAVLERGAPGNGDTSMEAADDEDGNDDDSDN